MSTGGVLSEQRVVGRASVPGLGARIDRFRVERVLAPTLEAYRFAVRDEAAGGDHPLLELRLARDPLGLASLPWLDEALARLGGRSARLGDPVRNERRALERLHEVRGVLPLVASGVLDGERDWLVVACPPRLCRLDALEAPLARWQVVAVLCRVWSTLCAVHREGVVHRDLHPGQLLLDASWSTLRKPSALRAGHRLILDGFCHALVDGRGYDRLDGFAPWHAPEQWAAAHGEGLDDWTTDLHGLGWLAATLLGGGAPPDWRQFVEGERRAEAALEVIERELDAELADTVLGLVALDRVDRAEAADELGARLRALCAAYGLDESACHLDGELQPPQDDEDDDEAHAPEALAVAERGLASWLDEDAQRAARDAWWEAHLWRGKRSVPAVALVRHARALQQAREEPDAWWLELRVARAQGDVFEVLRLTDGLGDDESAAPSAPWGEVLAHRAWALARCGQAEAARLVATRALAAAPQDLFAIIEALRCALLRPDARLPPALAVRPEWTLALLEAMLERQRLSDAVELCTWALDARRREAGAALALTLEHLLAHHRRHPLQRRRDGATAALVQALMLAALASTDEQLGLDAPLQATHPASPWLALPRSVLAATPSVVPRGEDAPAPVLCSHLAALLEGNDQGRALDGWLEVLPALATNRELLWTGTLRTGLGAEILGRAGRDASTPLGAARGARALASATPSRERDDDHHRDSLAFALVVESLGDRLTPADARRLALGWGLQRLGLHQRVEAWFSAALGERGERLALAGDTRVVFVLLLWLAGRGHLARRMASRLDVAREWPLVAHLLTPSLQVKASRHPLVDTAQGRMRRFLELRAEHADEVARVCRRWLVSALQDRHWQPTAPVRPSFLVVALLWWRAVLQGRSVHGAWPLARALFALEPSLGEAFLRDLDDLIDRAGPDERLEPLIATILAGRREWQQLERALPRDSVTWRRRSAVRRALASFARHGTLPDVLPGLDEASASERGRAWAELAEALLADGAPQASAAAGAALEHARGLGVESPLLVIRSLEARGRSDLAWRELQRAQHRLGLDQGELLTLRARLLGRLGAPDEALAAARRAVALRPDLVESRVALLELLRDHDQSVEGTLLVDALRWHGHDGEVVERVVQLLDERGQTAHAIAVLERFVEVGLAAPRHWHRLAQLLLVQGRARDALVVTTRLLGEAHAEVDARTAHVGALRMLGHADEAVAVVLDALAGSAGELPVELLAEGLRAALGIAEPPAGSARLVAAVEAAAERSPEALAALLEWTLVRGAPARAVELGAQLVARQASLYHRCLYVAALALDLKRDVAGRQLEALQGEPLLAAARDEAAQLAGVSVTALGERPLEAALCVAIVHLARRQRALEALALLERLASTRRGEQEREALRERGRALLVVE